MTKEEQIEEIAKYICKVCEMGHGFNGDCSEGGTDHYKHCTITQETAEALYEEGYRKVPDGAVVLTPEERGDEIRETDEIIKERNNLLARVGVLGREVEELKAKLKECDIADDYTIGFATYSAQKQHKKVDKIKTDNEQIKEIEEVLINKSKYTGKDCTDCDHWFGSFCGAPIKCQAEAIYEAGYRKSPDKKIVFIDVSEPKKERIIPEGEPIKDIGAEGALGIEGKTSCDVSEYEADIKRLRNANSELVDNLVFYKDKSYKLEKNVDKLKTEIKQEVKQAQIDVLNKLKDKYGFYACYSWHCDTKLLSEIIDELIKEVQNGEDKN